MVDYSHYGATRIYRTSILYGDSYCTLSTESTGTRTLVRTPSLYSEYRYTGITVLVLSAVLVPYEYTGYGVLVRSVGTFLHEYTSKVVVTLLYRGSE